MCNVVLIMIHVAAGPEAMAKDALDFGIVLFELLTGRHSGPILDEEGPDGLVEWAEAYVADFDEGGGPGGPTKRMVVRMMDVIAQECVQDDPQCRPSMQDLIVRLLGLQETLTSH